MRPLRAYPWGLHLLCITPCLLTITYLALAHGTGVELAAHYAAVAVAHPGITRFFNFLAHTINPLYYLAITALLWRARKRGDKALLRFVLAYIMVQLAVSFLLVRTLKICVGKPRPDALLAGAHYEHFTFKQGLQSFPSGHVTEGSTSAVSLSCRPRSPLLALGLGLVTALTAYSRVFLSMHHLWDLFAGLVIGSFAAIVIHLLCAERTS